MEHNLLSGGGSVCTFMYMYTMLLSGLCFYVILGKIKSRVDFSYPGNKGENHIWIEHPLAKNAFMQKFKNEL